MSGANLRGGTILVDSRCLQDPDYAERGVGRHALELMRHFPRASKLRLIGLIDPSLPPLSNEARELLDGISPNAYAAARKVNAPSPAGFVSLSPMTHDPLFAARLIAENSYPRIAVVYDFIPRRFPDRYLPKPADRLGYALQLRWLASHNHFCCISHSTADDLRSALNVSKRAVTVTGAPLLAAFAKERSGRQGSEKRPYILFVGGGDSRKNPEVVIRAHAQSGLLQEAGVPLILAGNYSPDHAAAFKHLSQACGGLATLVIIPGTISESSLIDLYSRARVLVCSSVDEGFSIPIVEGMASGAVVLVSDIPAHAELVPDAECRFGPNDDTRLGVLLERAWTEESWRAKLLAVQQDVWPRYLGAEVAAKFWASTMRLLSSFSFQFPTPIRNHKPRIAMLSPLPPDRTGVADYSSATCEELGRISDLEVFSETQSPSRLRNASIHPLSALPCIAPSFDRVIGVIGNSEFHTSIFNLLQRYGGAAIAHDARMLSFYWGLLGEERTISLASHELGRKVLPEEISAWLQDESTLEALFLGEVACAASPMIVHSPVTLSLVREKYGVDATYLPFCIYRSFTSEEVSQSNRLAARARLGVVSSEVLIVTFGFVHSSKAPEECIWAVEFLRRWGIPATVHFVGGVNNLLDGGESLMQLAETLGVRQHVKLVAEYVPETRYRDYLLGADAAIQLRTYQLGGLSGALLDCMGAGLPTVTNAGLAEAAAVQCSYIREIPNALSPLLVAERIADLLETHVTKQEKEAERQAVSEERSFRRYSQLLYESLGLDLAT